MGISFGANNISVVVVVRVLTVMMRRLIAVVSGGIKGFLTLKVSKLSRCFMSASTSSMKIIDG